MFYQADSPDLNATEKRSTIVKSCIDELELATQEELIDVIMAASVALKSPWRTSLSIQYPNDLRRR
jgi:hypothetical protein